MLFKDHTLANPVTDDDIKWSIYLQKTLANYIIINAQVASDHFRPSYYMSNELERNESAFTAIEDWYWMFKIGYIF